MYGLVLERCSSWTLAVCDETSNWFVVRNRIQQFRCHISGGQSGGHAECMYLGRACELCGLFICLWTRVGAASGLVGCQYVVLRCGAVGTCRPQLSTVVWAGKGVGQPLWTKDSLTCVVKTYRAKQASGGCEHSCDGRDRCTYDIEPFAIKAKRIRPGPNLFSLSKALAGNYLLFFDYFSLMLMCRFSGGDAFRGCIVCNLGIFYFYKFLFVIVRVRRRGNPLGRTGRVG